MVGRHSIDFEMALAAKVEWAETEVIIA